ncbi:putative quinol monooxygenase [Leucothrix mucor]|uniref:putative quinol monooxygenase n=1 Tax=Leucothrix mucor TaxID=45248 RepID=UPI0003B68DB7|nr:putative quinol monooxygenase [Leucothrix mucor]
MFMVLVDFVIQPDKADQFYKVVLEQAKNSLDEEPDCHFFEVTRSPGKPESFVLSEVYTSSEAFDRHLKTQHFLTFDALVSDWVQEKSVRTLA